MILKNADKQLVACAESAHEYRRQGIHEMVYVVTFLHFQTYFLARHSVRLLFSVQKATASFASFLFKAQQDLKLVVDFVASQMLSVESNAVL